MATEVFMRMKAVRAATSLGRTSIYKLIRAKKFPRPVKIGEQARAWPESEINSWMAERMAERAVNRNGDLPRMQGSRTRGPSQA